jgi:hypothetical protein
MTSFPVDHNDEHARDMRLLINTLETLLYACVGNTTGRARERLSSAVRMRANLRRMLAIVEGWIGE